IGRGGMAVVFFATDSRDDRHVALKLVPLGTDRDSHEVLEAERWGAKLQEQFCRISQNVPVVYEHGTEGGYFYIAMEYLDGWNLSEILAAGPLPPERAARVAIQLCHFLEAAHGFEATIDGRQLRSLLHGDLKPRNIRLLRGDQVKILDFGIAKALSLSRKVTHNDFGSLTYVSPERLESGEIDTYADFWAVGVLLYEMLSGIQPYRAPDSRLLELRIRSLQPPDPLGESCPPGLRAVVAKLLAEHPADRYRDARAIREDLECVTSGCVTQAEREGWSAAGARIDEAPTVRTPALTRDDADALPPTVRVHTDPGTVVAAPANVIFRPAEARPMTRDRPASRYARVALLLLASFVAGHELMIALRAERLRTEMPTVELDGVGGLWQSYHTLSSESLGITTARLEHALTGQTVTLADRIIGNYRSSAPTVRETQWKMAREALAQALSVNPDDSQLKGALRYCDGHLHRINGEARKAHQQKAEAQREFTEAVSAFREATELRPGWPDPFLGLTRTFIYGLEDVDRGADALQQAQRLGYTAGVRETVQLADGYRLRAMALARRAHTVSDAAVEREYLARSADAYRRAIALYSKAAGFAEAPRSLRAAQRGLTQVEQQKTASSGAAGRNRRSHAVQP
ncbi:MAG TPA: serine/threonine-protein kinase, partial [Vicinamibacterales bacterium]|nr:serine/threonine-protein kinase [Vicinamibacterales bacterium]